MEILERFKEIIAPIQQPTIFEFGACNAVHSRIMLDILQGTNKKYTFHLFEPNPDLLHVIVDILKYYLTSNGDNVRFFNEAISESNGQIPFYKSGGENYYGSSSTKRPKLVRVEFRDMTFIKKTTNAISLDYHIQRTGLQEQIIDFIWANIQGAESDLIKGGVEAFKKVRYIYLSYMDIEYYQGCANLKQLCDLLPNFEIIEDYQGYALLKNKNL
jgi:2-O-methyltransferase